MPSAKGETFGTRLKGMRVGRGLTQPALAEAAGLGLPTIKDYEGDRRTPSLENAQRLAAALGAKVGAFDGVRFLRADQRAAKARPAGPSRNTPKPAPETAG